MDKEKYLAEMAALGLDPNYKAVEIKNRYVGKPDPVPQRPVVDNSAGAAATPEEIKAILEEMARMGIK